jgi:myo-inositol 2-dehydrogenase / D-chiro-inositol 1-dehydrogenase
MGSERANVRVGVLGVGRIGKIHAGNLANRIPGAELAALADMFPGELAAVAARAKVARTFADYRELLALPDVDAIAICTPTGTHYEIIRDAAAAGKHIFCEKPLELSVERIEEINRLVAESGVLLMVGFNRRFDPNFVRVRESVRAGKIGAPHLLRITSRDPAPPPESYIRSSGGLFLDMTIHDFDMARYLTGSEVVEVYARAESLVDPMIQRAGDWDTAIVTLSFQSGALAAIDNSRKAVYGYDQRVEVFGSEGMLAVANSAEDAHVYWDREGSHSAPLLNFFLERYAESYLREMHAFVDAVRQGAPAPVGGKDGLIAVAIALAASRSARENRPVKVAEACKVGVPSAGAAR